MLLVLRRFPVRLCRGICHSSHPVSTRHGLGHSIRPVNQLSLLGKCARTWLKPSTAVLAQTSQQVLLQYGVLHSSVATFSSLHSPADLCAAITDAPTHAALQALAATAASIPQQSWLAQEYKLQLLASLDQQTPAHLVNSLLFFAKLGAGHLDLFQAAVPVVYNQLGRLTPQQLLHVLTAFATAAQHSPAAYSQELFAAATEFLWEGLEQLEPCALADVAAAYAAVQHYDDDEDFFEGLAALALKQTQAFCPDDLSRLCYSLACLRFSAPELNSAALSQLSAQVEAWPLSCTGKLLWALAAVQATPDPCLLDRVAAHVSVVLRNLRTSTDGQRVLASLGAQGAHAAAAGAASNGVCVGRVTVAGDMHGLGLGAGSSAPPAGHTAGMSPTWQGFGITRSSSSSSGSPVAAGVAATAAGMDSSASSSSSSSTVPAVDGAASIWAAANSSMMHFEYSEEAAEQDNPLGPDYIMVTSYGPDGRVTTEYIKRSEAAGRQSTNISSTSSSSTGGDTGSGNGSSSSSTSGQGIGGSSGLRGSSTKHSRGGLMLPPSTRAVSSTSSSSSSSSTEASSSSSSSSSDRQLTWAQLQQQRRQDECPAASWQTIIPVAPDCRPIYDDAQSLQAALVNVSWAFAMLGHLHSNTAKECFKALAMVAPEAFTDEQLVMLWAAHMRYQQLGHVMLDPNPLLAESYSVFLKELSRAAPRTISLANHLQPLAAANWLLHSMRQAPEYDQQLKAHQGQQQQQEEDHDQQQQQHFSSWKFRDAAVLTHRSLEASVRQALLHLGLPVGEPCTTLDGVERVGLPLKHNGVSVAWQVVPPAWCCRNPPYAPTVDAAMHKWALQYRGYTVLQVPFHEWAAVLESGDVIVQAGYLQNKLNGVSVRVPKMSNF